MFKPVYIYIYIKKKIINKSLRFDVYKVRIWVGYKFIIEGHAGVGL
jgi:hypothetical protein